MWGSTYRVIFFLGNPGNLILFNYTIFSGLIYIVFFGSFLSHFRFDFDALNFARMDGYMAHV